MARSGSVGEEILIERRFAAAREAVFAAWTDASEIATWFAAAPFVVTSVDWTPCEGSPWRVDFRSPDGSAYREEGVFLEVRAPERLVFSLTQIGLPSPGPETIVTVTFKAEADVETLMVFRQIGFVSAEVRRGNELGWGSCFDALSMHLGVRRAAAVRGADG
jgi:uncharacterized protein YndB with AHSA1/START domain